MRRTCAWCKGPLDHGFKRICEDIKFVSSKDKKETHGICPNCMKEFAPIAFSEYLEEQNVFVYKNRFISNESFVGRILKSKIWSIINAKNQFKGK